MIRKLGGLVGSVLAVGVTGYTYVSYQTSKNKSEYLKYLETQKPKSIQNLNMNNNNNININNRQDNTIQQIKKNINSGDYALIYYNYNKTLNTMDYIKGCAWEYWKGEGQFDGFGYFFKNGQQIYVYYNQFGVSKIRKYQQFLDLPYVVGIIIQNNKKNKQINLQQKLRKIVEKQYGKIQVQETKQNAVQMANRVNQKLYEDKTQYIMDLRQLLTQTSSVLIRTRAGNQLLKKQLDKKFNKK